MIEFTPGPWTATWTHETRCAIHSSGWMSVGAIAVVHAAGNDGDFTKETAEANAKLLAAAPELLAALQHMHNVFGPTNTSVGGKGALMQARQVINKALGL